MMGENQVLASVRKIDGEIQLQERRYCFDVLTRIILNTRRDEVEKAKGG